MSLSSDIPIARRPENLAGANPYRWVVRGASGGALLATALLTIVVAYEISRGTSLSNLVGLGYPGVLLAMFFSSATVLLPAPGLLAVMAAGSVHQFNPWLLGVFAGLGSSAGELTGYLVGLGGRQVLQPSNNPWMRRCEYLMRRWGFMTIMIMAAIPNPFFDVAGIVAGGLGYPSRR